MRKYDQFNFDEADIYYMKLVHLKRTVQYSTLYYELGGWTGTRDLCRSQEDPR